VNVIAYRRIREFCEEHPDAEQSLKTWHHVAKEAKWKSSADIKQRYGDASIVSSERVVFNLRGNRYRLVARINYVSGTVFVRFIGTHREYDRIDVESI